MLKVSTAQPMQSDVERRRFQRVKVSLLGRYMLPSRQEFPCQAVDMSPGGCALIVPVSGNVGDRVVVYLDHIGRIEGRIARLIEGGFAMTISATPHKRDKLAAQLTWLANRESLGLAEDRRHDRMTPANPFSRITLGDGREFPCRIIDMSLSGAGVSSEILPPVGSPITLGRTRGQVVRHIPNGFAIEFARPQEMAELTAQFGELH